jgi:hypothetical protein
MQCKYANLCVLKFILISIRGQSTKARMSDDAPDSLIPYDDVVQEALRAVVGRVLGEVAWSAACPATIISTSPSRPVPLGVAIPVHLMERFPDEMTIVMQHKYWDLKVGEDYFEVGLSFSQVPAHLHIPFSAITAFVDPAVDFALQFHVDAESGPEPHDRPKMTGQVSSRRTARML